MNFMKKNKKGGFTLLELLIVIAILAILSVALVIVLKSDVRSFSVTVFAVQPFERSRRHMSSIGSESK